MTNKFILTCLLFLIITFLVSEFSETLVNYIAKRNIAEDNDIVNQSLTVQIILGIILSPIIETIFFQQLPIHFTRKAIEGFPENYIFPVLFSALFFSFFHLFSIYYMLDGFIMGVCFAFSYLWTFDKYNSKLKAFIVVWLSHAFLNTIAILS